MIIKIALALPFSAIICAQQTWKVNCAGLHGAHFTDLPPAVAAAAPGDTILLYLTAGCSQTFSWPPVIDKGITINCFFVGGQPGNNTPTLVPVDGHLHIANIPLGQRFVLTNAYVDHITNGAGSIRILDCHGDIILDNLEFSNSGSPGQIIDIERCDNVILRGSYFSIGGAPIRIIDSNVLMTTTGVSWVAPFSIPIPGYYYTTTTESIFLQRSTLTVSGSLIEGVGALNFQPVRPAIRMDGSTLRVGAASALYGGRIPPAPYILPSQFGAPIQVVAPAPSIIEADPRARIWNTSVAVTLTPIHETFHDWVVADEWFSVRPFGPQNGFALLAFADLAYPNPSPYGTLGLDLGTMTLLDVVPLTAANGVYTWNFFCPSNAPVGHPFAFQCLTLAPDGTLGLTVPSPMTVAWDKTAIP